MLQPFFSARPSEEPRDVASVSALQDTVRYRAFCDALEANGVYSHRYPLGRWFVSVAHEEAEIAETVTAVRSALARLPEPDHESAGPRVTA